MVDEREKQLVELVNRFHGHIGIYSMLGVKMGLRIREIFSADGLQGPIGIVAYTGSEPPVSCLLDGLQASTGSTLGHGLIRVAQSPNPPRAMAAFTCGGKTVSLALKPAFESRIEADIKRGVSLYGHAPQYWEYVENLALRYAREWDREEIFQPVNSCPPSSE